MWFRSLFEGQDFRETVTTNSTLLSERFHQELPCHGFEKLSCKVELRFSGKVTNIVRQDFDVTFVDFVVRVFWTGSWTARKEITKKYKKN